MIKEIRFLRESLTTKQYYNYYFNLKEGIPKDKLLNLVRDLYKDVGSLQDLYNLDVHLNNINMLQIDNKFNEVRYLLNDYNKLKKVIEGERVYTYMSLSQSCSFIKHILIYDVLEIKPIFQEDILNYNELYKEWYNLEDKIKYRNNFKGFGLDMWFLHNQELFIMKGGLKNEKHTRNKK